MEKIKLTQKIVKFKKKIRKIFNLEFYEKQKNKFKKVVLLLNKNQKV